MRAIRPGPGTCGKNSHRRERLMPEISKCPRQVSKVKPTLLDLTNHPDVPEKPRGRVCDRVFAFQIPMKQMRTCIQENWKSRGSGIPAQTKRKLYAKIYMHKEMARGTGTLKEEGSFMQGFEPVDKPNRLPIAVVWHRGAWVTADMTVASVLTTEAQTVFSKKKEINIRLSEYLQHRPAIMIQEMFHVRGMLLGTRKKNKNKKEKKKKKKKKKENKKKKIKKKK